MSLSGFPLGLYTMLGKWNIPPGGVAPTPPPDTFFLTQLTGERLLQLDNSRIIYNA